MENTNHNQEGSSRTDTKQEVLYILSKNLHGCDMLLCLFMAALKSYKADQCLRPFPPMFVDNNHKNIYRLRDMCDALPPLSDILENRHSCSKEVFDLLYWLFSTGGHPLLQRINYNSVNHHRIPKSYQPHYIFEVVYPSRSETIWQRRKGSDNSFLAYHGSLIQNFYSILRVGLQQSFSETKEVLFGKGIYLTTELSVCMLYAPFGISWKQSSLGNKHSIIAVCEVIDHVEKVRCKGRIIDDESSSPELPDKYFVVTDSEVVRLKYLFVYKCNSTIEWTNKKLVIVLIIIYIIILCFNRFFQTPTWNKLFKRFYNNF